MKITLQQSFLKQLGTIIYFNTLGFQQDTVKVKLHLY